MMKRSVKQQLNAKLNEMNMNLANNYKDLAHDALKELDQMVEEIFIHILFVIGAYFIEIRRFGYTCNF